MHTVHKHKNVTKVSQLSLSSVLVCLLLKGIQTKPSIPLHITSSLQAVHRHAVHSLPLERSLEITSPVTSFVTEASLKLLRFI